MTSGDGYIATVTAASRAYFKSNLAASSPDGRSRLERHSTRRAACCDARAQLDVAADPTGASRGSGYQPPDILIEPHLRDIGLLEFEKAKELYAAGQEAVDRLEKQILYQLNYLDVK